MSPLSHVRVHWECSSRPDTGQPSVLAWPGDAEARSAKTRGLCAMAGKRGSAWGRGNVGGGSDFCSPFEKHPKDPRGEPDTP